jgi:hypothetical protein
MSMLFEDANGNLYYEEELGLNLKGKNRLKTIIITE